MPWVPGLSVRALTHERTPAGASHDRTVAEALLALAAKHALAAALVTPAARGGLPAAEARSAEGAALTVELADRAERLEPLLPQLAACVPGGLLTVTAVRLYIPPAELLVRDVLIAPRVTVRPEAPLGEALAHLLGGDMRLLMVTSPDGVLLGILTLGHLLRSADPELAAHLLEQGSPERARAHVETLVAGRTTSDAMLPRREVWTLRPADSLREAARLLEAHGLTRAPVVDAAGRVAGLLRERELVSALVAPLPRNADGDGAGEPVTVPSATGTLESATAGTLAVAASHLPEDAPLERIVEALRAAPAGLALVVAPDGRLRGVVDERALLEHAVPGGGTGGLRAALRRALGHTPQRVLAAVTHHAAPGTTARDLLRPPPLTLPADTPAVEALARMVAAHADAMVVVTAAGEPVGVLPRRVALRLIAG